MVNYKHNGHYSQFGEQGIIDEVIKRLKLKPSVAVEFGAPTREFCSNIFHLLEKGWDCLYFDMDPTGDWVTKLIVTPENVNQLPKCNILSIDCDGPDYGIWEAYVGKPALVIIEINSSLDPNVDYFGPKGANYSIMKKLGEAKGYKLLCHTGNMLFVDAKHTALFPDADETFNTAWR